MQIPQSFLETYLSNLQTFPTSYMKGYVIVNFMSDAQKLKDSSGKSIRQIAAACGLAESTTSRYLSGKAVPPADVADNILKYLSESAPDPDKTIEIPSPMYLMLIESYKKQIAELRTDHEKHMKKAEIRFYFMFGLVVALIAIVIYLVLDATHGGWGFFRYSADLLRTGAL